MNVEVKLPNVEKLTTSTKFVEEEGLVTKVSFEFKGPPLNIARLINLQKQNKTLHATITCDQAVQDLVLAEKKEKEPVPA